MYMKTYPLQSFTIAFLITAFLSFIIGVMLCVATFSLGGGETLQEVEDGTTAVLVIVLVVCGIAGCVVAAFIKSGKKYTAWGVGIIPGICLVIGLAVFINMHRVTPFNQEVWKRASWKPFNMAATLVKRHTLIGLTKQQVVNLLGSLKYIEPGDIGIDYRVEGNWTLSIYFKNGKVVGTQLRLPFLCV